MKKIFAALILAITIQSAAFAQDGQHMRRTPEERAKNQVEMMKPLKLTEDQQKKVYDFNLQMSNEALGGADDSRETKMAKARTFQAQRNDAYKKILTAEQFAQFESIQAEKREQFKARRMERKDSAAE